MTKKKRKQKSSNNRNCGSTSNELYVCPNRLCNLTMTSQQGWVSHYLHHSDCFKATGGLTVFWERRAAETRVDHKQAFFETDSEDEDNIPDTQPDDGSEIDLNVEGCTDTGSFTNIHAVATQRGVNHTVNDYIETKLLKILEDANVPHFQYRDVLNWGSKAKAEGTLLNPNGPCESSP
jgi:hypothetical protein